MPGIDKVPGIFIPGMFISELRDIIRGRGWQYQVNEQRYGRAKQCRQAG
jgi:hypothetical protein